MMLPFRSTALSVVIAGLDPAIQDRARSAWSSWMPGLSPGMATERSQGLACHSKGAPV